ncbi:MAG: DUF1080 domain-containing protein [Verrucomicrobia bacterium]|nr:DUF1080 domain-containing protein [Verrucomicrobiota bacterium]
MHALPKVVPWWSLLAWILTVSAPAAEPAESQAFGWVSLFNGRDLTGWEVKCRPADAQRVWFHVVDGAIEANSLDATGHDYVWLTTAREYTNFVLRLQFQAFRDSPGNTGVQIRSRYDTAAGWLDGPQVDIHPTGWWRTGMVWDETRGNQRWLWPAVPAGQWVDETMAKPGSRWFFADEPPGWNQLEIAAEGTRLRASLNGIPVMDWDGTGVLDDATHRERRVGLHGHIALQIHRGDQLRVRFKDLQIRELR